MHGRSQVIGNGAKRNLSILAKEEIFGRSRASGDPFGAASRMFTEPCGRKKIASEGSLLLGGACIDDDKIIRGYQ
jgi:hypothetical protein